ncbi:DUF4374 domain-containing protein [Formosa sp. S-31]|uniref:DUF4374 domain-containing protein n=1 Tax=Formosa sp. S-31 TaxID=2790949 RepID=UPI003EB8E392
MKTNFKPLNMLRKPFLFSLLATSLIVSCSDDDSPSTDPDPEPEGAVQYFIAAENGNGTYYINVDDLTQGTTTTTGNGIEDPNTYTHYAYNGTKAVIGLSYRQGNPAIGHMFGLDQTGNLEEIGAGFQMTNGYSSLGPFENYIVTTRSGVTFADDTVGANFYFIDLDNNGAVSQKTLETMDLVGNGLDTGLVGIADCGDGSFISAVQLTDGDINECYVVKLDADLNVLQVMHDDRIGEALGRWRSARYSLLANDDDGNTYVFANPNGGTKSGAVLKINQGASDFDASYYFDIQALSDGFGFRKVWHITESYFLLEFYNELEPSNNTAAYQYAVVNTASKTFSWINGLPDSGNVSGAGWPFAADGKAYLPITTNDTAPTVYVIDPSNATATAGIVVEGATDIGGLAKLQYEE